MAPKLRTHLDITNMQKILFCSFGTILFFVADQSYGFQNVQQKLRVETDKASIYLDPDLTSAIIGYAPRKTILSSYKSETGWYRVVLPPDRDNVTIIGYISAKDVTVLEEKVAERQDFWGPGEGKFKGIGLEVQAGAGIIYFGGGDITRGVRGMFDEYAASIDALGYPILNRNARTFRSGSHFALDLAFRINPKLSAGLKSEYLRASIFDEFMFQEGTHYHTGISHPVIETFIIRPSLYLTFPLSRIFSFKLDGGPAIFITNFDYYRNVATTVFNEYFHLGAKTVALGAQVGVSLEVNLNERTALFLLTTGQLARASSLTGSETYNHFVRSYFEDTKTLGWQYQGTLFFWKSGSFPALTVRSEKPSSDARSAVFDFAGVSFLLGLRLKI